MQPVTHSALDLPGIRHGFFTREGGVSEGVYASLNCGPGSNDAPEKIAENRARCAREFALPAEALLTCYQIHSPDVITVEKPFTDRPQADALVTDRPGLMLGILTADCAPVLFTDGKIIGAAHAGWKGAISGVVENTIAAMEKLGAKREHIRAMVGPCIQQASYEVGADFMQNFTEKDPSFARFFDTAKAKPHFDLPGFVLHQLAASGLKNTGALPMDTVTDEAQFFSYRRKTLRGEPDYARQLSAIALTGTV